MGGLFVVSFFTIYMNRRINLIHKIGSWFVPARQSWRKSRSAKRVLPLSLRRSFTRLERRQMFAVDAFFSLSGDLSIEITAVGETQANLLSDGLDFFVDANNNLSYDPFEKRGSMEQLNSISVNSPDALGTLLWQGDFYSAPFASLQSVDIQSIQSVEVNANFTSVGNVTINVSHHVVLSSEANIGGDFFVQVGPAGTISDTIGASVAVLGDATFVSQTDITLADSISNRWIIAGHSQFQTTGSVDLGSLGAFDVNELSVEANDATIVEPNAMVLREFTISGDLNLRANASVEDLAGSTIQVDGSLSIRGGTVTLADNAGDLLLVVGEGEFFATSGDVMVADKGTVTLGSLSASGANITVFEDDAMQIQSLAATGNVELDSTAAISDSADAHVTVRGSLIVTGTSVTLAENETDVLRVFEDTQFIATAGDVSLGAAGDVRLGRFAANGVNITLQEDDDSNLRSINASGNLNITSVWTISDKPGAAIRVGGNATFRGESLTFADNAGEVLVIAGLATFTATAGDVNLGPSGDVRLGVFAASGVNIFLHEDDSSELGTVEATGSLETTSAMDIGTTTNARIEALRWDAYAKGSIRLADSFASSITIENEAFMRAAGNVLIEQPGVVRFGSIGFSAGDVFLSQDSPTHLDGSLTRSLVVESVQRITQSGMDTGSGVRDLHVAGDARFDLSSEPGEVYLLRQSTSPPTLLADGRLSQNRIDGIVSVLGILGNLELRNVSPTATVGALEGAFEDFRLWHPNSNILLQGDIRVNGDMDVIAGMESSDTSLGSGNPIDLVSSPNASVQDRGTLIVQGDARFTAAGDIRLSDARNESIRVNGSTSLVSLNAGQLVFGTEGAAQSTGLAAYSMDADGNRGDLIASLDTSTVWGAPQVAFPDGRFLPSLLENLTLEVNGNLDDTFQANIQLTGDLDITATGSINWGDQFSNTLQVGGNSLIQSIGGHVVLGSEGVVSTENIRIEAVGGTILVGGAGWTRLGVVELFADSIALSEDESLVVRTAIANDNLELSSRQEIINLTPYDAGSREGISASRGLFQSGSHIFLGQVSIGELQAAAHANGMLPDTLLFQLNEVADRVGQRFLDVFGSNLPPGIQTNTALINGTSLSTTMDEASLIQQFGREYGVYLTNLRSLQLQGLTTDGDGVRVYVETLNGQNLQVAGNVSLNSTTTDVGGIVLIAGGRLDILGTGELQIQQSSRPMETQRVVRDEHFSIRAFDGGTGLPGYLSTRDVLYASDASADGGTQNVLQRVAIQYGNRGEAGFENWVQYADGRIQNFDQSGQLFASQMDSNPQVGRVGPLRAFDPTTSDIAVVERATPYEDSLLNSFQTLPTLAVFRRDFSFFLFEQGGNLDLASSTEQSPAFDPVFEVYSTGRKVSLPLPTDIVVARPILVPSQPWVPNAESAVSLGTTELQSSPVSQANFEIAIYEIGFDDANGDGQPDDSELPLRNRIVFSENDETSKQVDGQDIEKSEVVRPKSTEVQHGGVVEETRNIKGVAAATTEQLDNWVDEYRKDPLRRSGAYAIISKDSIKGVEVLRVFSIRDSETDKVNESVDQPMAQPNGSLQEPEVGNDSKTDNATPPPPVKPVGRDDLSFAPAIDNAFSLERLGCHEVFAGGSIAMVIASRIAGKESSETSFRRRARRRRNGEVT
jgi:hypothetical protein